MSTENNGNGYTIAVFLIVFLTVLGTGLKLANIITLPWAAVLAPVWAPIGTIFVLWVIGTLLTGIGAKAQAHNVNNLSVVR